MTLFHPKILRYEVRSLVSRMIATAVADTRPRILMYHRIFESDHRLAVRPELFIDHLDFFERNHWEVLSIRDLLNIEGERGARTVALSFDDGYKEMVTIVAPELRKRGMGATFFVLPRMAAGGFEISPEASFSDGGANFLSHEDIINLDEWGFEIGAHSLTHRSVSDLDGKESWIEIHNSGKELAQLLGKKITGLAYPKGRFTQSNQVQAIASGYEYAVGVQSGPVAADRPLWALPRCEVAGGDTPETVRSKLAGGLDYWHDTLSKIRKIPQFGKGML